MVVQNCFRGKMHPETVECSKPKDWEESADLREYFSCQWLLVGQQRDLHIIQEPRKTQQKSFLGKHHFSTATSTGLLFLLLPHHQPQMQIPLIPQGHEPHHPRAVSTACIHFLGAFHWHTGNLHWSRILYQAGFYSCDLHFMVCSLPDLKRGIWTTDEFSPLSTVEPLTLLSQKATAVSAFQEKQQYCAKCADWQQVGIGFLC